jgi:type IV/VI secretion system ImpK/VasF family protein
MHLDLKDHVTRLTFFTLNLVDEIHTSPQDVDAKECRGTCVELLRAFDQSESLPETFQLAKYALTAWIDDLLCRAKWPHAAAWRQYPLEQELFGTTCRHWRFFEQAETALCRGDWNALLVFRFCVEFGFLGIYAKDRVRVRLSDRLPMMRSPSDRLVPIMSGIFQEDRFEGPAAYADTSESASDLGPRSSSFRAASTDASETVLPPTLAEWSHRTFRMLGQSPEGESRSLLPLSQVLPATRRFTDWAIVMAVGVLLAAVLFAMGH